MINEPFAYVIEIHDCGFRVPASENEEIIARELQRRVNKRRVHDTLFDDAR